MEYYKRTWLSFTFDVLNTYDPYYEVPERLCSLEQLCELLKKHGLFCDESPTSEDVTTVRAYRDKLRKLINIESDKKLADFLTEFESRFPIQSRLSSMGNGRFKFIYEQPNRSKGALADRILSICSFTLGKELVENGRARLKICASTPCEEIFMDHSKNGLQRFCSKRCSTRFHVKKHRQSSTN